MERRRAPTTSPSRRRRRSRCAWGGRDCQFERSPPSGNATRRERRSAAAQQRSGAGGDARGRPGGRGAAGAPLMGHSPRGAAEEAEPSPWSTVEQHLRRSSGLGAMLQPSGGGRLGAPRRPRAHRPPPPNGPATTTARTPCFPAASARAHDAARAHPVARARARRPRRLPARSHPKRTRTHTFSPRKCRPLAHDWAPRWNAHAEVGRGVDQGGPAGAL